MLDLPSLPSRYSPTRASLQSYIQDIVEFLQSPLVLVLIALHPNQIATCLQPYAEPNVPKEWLGWWEFFDVLGEGEALLEQELSFGNDDLSKPLRRLVSAGELPPGAPPSMHEFLRRVNDLQLARTSAIPTSSPTNGMSPKKSHEVHRLSTCIRSLCESSRSPQGHQEVSSNVPPFVVDVGTGQGYLARELAFPSIPSARPMHVLALDSDMDQINGANRRGGHSAAESKACLHPDTDGSPCKCGSITYRNTFVSSDSLAQEIESWVASFHCDTQRHVGHIRSDHPRPYPVIMTGLHTCGSLTPTVLRSFVSLADPDSTPPSSHSSGIQWKPSALALVGCCYNMMKESDFPMTRWDGFAPLELTRQHLQLACQCPYQWTLSDSSWRVSRLSRKKVVYRALLGRLLSQRARHYYCPGGPGAITLDENGEEGEASDVLGGKKLGRLNSSAYASWSTFLQQASFRLGLSDILDPEYHLGLEHGSPEEYPRLPPRLACLHAMRGLLGPVIESLIIADRILYLVNHLHPNWNIHAVNVFDLASGSARNMALVVDRPVDDG